MELASPSITAIVDMKRAQKGSANTVWSRASRFKAFKVSCLGKKRNKVPYLSSLLQLVNVCSIIYQIWSAGAINTAPRPAILITRTQSTPLLSSMNTWQITSPKPTMIIEVIPFVMRGLLSSWCRYQSTTLFLWLVLHMFRTSGTSRGADLVIEGVTRPNCCEVIHMDLWSIGTAWSVARLLRWGHADREVRVESIFIMQPFVVRRAAGDEQQQRRVRCAARMVGAEDSTTTYCNCQQKEISSKYSGRVKKRPVVVGGGGGGRGGGWEEKG